MTEININTPDLELEKIRETLYSPNFFEEFDDDFKNNMLDFIETRLFKLKSVFPYDSEVSRLISIVYDKQENK